MTQRFLSGAVLFLAAILTGCASSLPPAQPATSLDSIAGKWEGSLTDARGEPLYPDTLVIRKDGTYQSTVPALKGSPFTGAIVIQDGKFRWTVQDREQGRIRAARRRRKARADPDGRRERLDRRIQAGQVGEASKRASGTTARPDPRTRPSRLVQRCLKSREQLRVQGHPQYGSPSRLTVVAFAPGASIWT